MPPAATLWSMSPFPDLRLGVVALPAEPDPEVLHPDERRCLECQSSPRRKREWWAGRRAVHLAFEALGAPDMAVLSGPRGIPELRGPGAERWQLSIAHSRTFAVGLAAANSNAGERYGVDLVDETDRERVDRVARRNFSADELDLAKQTPEAPILGWGLREAVTKATQTGMFRFALKHGALRGVQPHEPTLSCSLGGIEATHQHLEGIGWVVVARASPKAIQSAQQIFATSRRG